jgi:hypothetical protein
MEDRSDRVVGRGCVSGGSHGLTMIDQVFLIALEGRDRYEKYNSLRSPKHSL